MPDPLSPVRRQALPEFIAMLALIFAVIAFSIDSMLPALPDIHFVGWRGVFGSFVVLALIGSLWLNLRCPETLSAPMRRPLNPASLARAAREVLGNVRVRLMSSAQQLFSETYGRGGSFPLWFAAMALLSGSGTVLNVRYVMRLGMRRIVCWAYRMQVIVWGAMVLLVFGDLLPEPLRFPAFFCWAVSVFFMAGVTFGNLNAMALQHMGHVAGMAASVVGAVSTLGAVLVAVPVGLLYDGSARPIVLATLICSGMALVLMGFLREG